MKDLAKGLCLHYNFDFEDLYQPIEYLESTGTQYINSGATIEANTHVEAKFMYTDISGSFPMLYGAWSVFSFSTNSSNGNLCISGGGAYNNN